MRGALRPELGGAGLCRAWSRGEVAGREAERLEASWALVWSSSFLAGLREPQQMPDPLPLRVVAPPLGTPTTAGQMAI